MTGMSESRLKAVVGVVDVSNKEIVVKTHSEKDVDQVMAEPRGCCCCCFCCCLKVWQLKGETDGDDDDDDIVKLEFVFWGKSVREQRR